MTDDEITVQAHIGDLEITVDRNTCIGSGNCTVWAPGTFTLTSDGLVSLSTAGGDETDAVVEAAQNCPVKAIKVQRV
jgi:ferredoxin